jgi:hypothetical protein
MQSLASTSNRLVLHRPAFRPRISPLLQRPLLSFVPRAQQVWRVALLRRAHAGNAPGIMTLPVLNLLTGL